MCTGMGCCCISAGAVGAVACVGARGVVVALGTSGWSPTGTSR